MIRIYEKNRKSWDFFVFLVIIFAAFEIPYELCVGIKNESISKVLNVFFFIIFFSDMVLNCITVRAKTHSGLWGWRNIAGLFSKKLSPETKFKQDPAGEHYYITQPEIALGYLMSGWFVVDFLAVFPFDLVLEQAAFLGMSRTLRLFRLPRLIRLIRTVRVIKTVRVFDYIQNYFSLHPAIGRFILILFIVPWLVHVHTCLYIYSIETDLNYSEALNIIYTTFATHSFSNTGSLFQSSVHTSATIFGFLFFGLFIGNFASLFNGIDANKALYEEKAKQWQSIFKAYPEVYDKEIQNMILAHIKTNIIHDETIQDYVQQIRSLEISLQQQVVQRVMEANQKYHSHRLDKLQKKLVQKQ